MEHPFLQNEDPNGSMVTPLPPIMRGQFHSLVWTGQAWVEDHRYNEDCWPPSELFEMQRQMNQIAELPCTVIGPGMLR